MPGVRARQHVTEVMDAVARPSPGPPGKALPGRSPDLPLGAILRRPPHRPRPRRSLGDEGSPRARKALESRTSGPIDEKRSRTPSRPRSPSVAEGEGRASTMFEDVTPSLPAGLQERPSVSGRGRKGDGAFPLCPSGERDDAPEMQPARDPAREDLLPLPNALDKVPRHPGQEAGRRRLLPDTDSKACPGGRIVKRASRHHARGAGGPWPGTAGLCPHRRREARGPAEAATAARSIARESGGPVCGRPHRHPPRAEPSIPSPFLSRSHGREGRLLWRSTAARAADPVSSRSWPA